MNTFDADDILSGLEAYIDELPAKRRKPYDDGAAEGENYGGLPVDATSLALELTYEEQVELHLLLFDLASVLSRKKAPQGPAFKRVRDLLCLSDDSPARLEALRRHYQDIMPGGAK